METRDRTAMNTGKLWVGGVIASVLVATGLLSAKSHAESHAPVAVPPLRAVDLAISARVIFAGTVQAIEPFQAGNAGRTRAVRGIESIQTENTGRTRQVRFRDIKVVGLPNATKEIALTVSDASIGNDGSGSPVTFALGARYVVFAESLLDDPAYLVMSWHGEPAGIFRVDLSANDSAQFVRGLDARLVEHMGKDFIISGSTPLIDADSSVARLTEERILEVRGEQTGADTPGSDATLAEHRPGAVSPRSAPITESRFLRLMSEWREEATRKASVAH